MDGLPLGNGHKLFFSEDNSELYVGKNNYGIYRRHILDGPVKISGPFSSTVDLHQNFPNPFNPSTTIRIGLPEQSSMTVRVFNTLGEEVRTLFSGDREPGYYDFVWDGKNSSGVFISTGLYFFRVEAFSVSGKTFAETRKMVMLK